MAVTLIIIMINPIYQERVRKKGHQMYWLKLNKPI